MTVPGGECDEIVQRDEHEYAWFFRSCDHHLAKKVFEVWNIIFRIFEHNQKRFCTSQKNKTAMKGSVNRVLVRDYHRLTETTRMFVGIQLMRTKEKTEWLVHGVSAISYSTSVAPETELLVTLKNCFFRIDGHQSVVGIFFSDVVTSWSLLHSSIHLSDTCSLGDLREKKSRDIERLDRQADSHSFVVLFPSFVDCIFISLENYHP